MSVAGRALLAKPDTNRTSKLIFINKKQQHLLYALPVLLYTTTHFPKEKWNHLLSTIENNLTTMSQRLAAANSSKRSRGAPTTALKPRLFRSDGFVYSYQLEATDQLLGVDTILNSEKQDLYKPRKLCRETLVIHAEVDGPQAVQRLPATESESILEEFFSGRVPLVFKLMGNFVSGFLLLDDVHATREASLEIPLLSDVAVHQHSQTQTQPFQLTHGNPSKPKDSTIRIGTFLHPRGWNALSFLRKWEIIRLVGVELLEQVAISHEMETCRLSHLRNLILDQPGFNEQNIGIPLSKSFETIDNPDQLCLPVENPLDGLECIVFNLSIKSNGNFQLDPPKLDQSFRFARKFGSSRFLYVNMNEITLNYPDQVLQLLCNFMERKYSFLVGKDGREKKAIYFAESGPGLAKVSVTDFANWHIEPESENLQIPMFKYFARFSIGFTRTDPVVVVDPINIILEEDHEVDGHVLTDGCASASMLLFRTIAERLKLRQIPTVVQARLGPFKGMWYADFDGEETHHRIYIKIRPSQQKFSWDPWTSDAHKMTFEVKRVVQAPTSSSSLNTQFIRTAVECPVHEIFDDFIFETFNKYEAKSEWVNKIFLSSDSNIGNSRDCIRELSQFSASGFDIFQEPYLRKLYITYLKNTLQSKILTKFQIPVKKSVRVPVIADPSGLLKKGEIFYTSSTLDSTRDKMLDFKYDLGPLFGCKVAISKNPCKSSKYGWLTAVNVFKKELMLYRDILIFPIHCPVSSMLAIGGDYDGDDVFLTWDERLVKNIPDRLCLRPVPVPDPSSYVISVKTSFEEGFFKLGESSWELLSAVLFLQYQNLNVGAWDNLELCYQESKYVDPKTSEILEWIVSSVLEMKKHGVKIGSKAYQLKERLRSIEKPFWMNPQSVTLLDERSLGTLTRMGHLWIHMRSRISDLENALISSIDLENTFQGDNDLISYMKGHVDCIQIGSLEFLDRFILERIQDYNREMRESLSNAGSSEERMKVYTNMVQHRLLAFGANNGINPELMACIVYSRAIELNPEGCFVWNTLGDYLCRIKADAVTRRKQNNVFGIARSVLH